jgi:hypothetical protein
MRRALKTVELRGLSWQERRSFDSGHVPQFIKMSKRKSKLSTCTSKPSSFFKLEEAIGIFIKIYSKYQYSRPSSIG